MNFHSPNTYIAWLAGILLWNAGVAVGWAGDARAERVKPSMVRVRVTSQSYDFFHPWEKTDPVSKEGIGVVVAGGRVLVTATLAENATYVELEAIDGNGKCGATVEQVDYSANLALLVLEDESCIKPAAKPLALAPKNLELGDSLTVWQFEGNGTPVVTEGELNSIEVAPYPYGDSALLTFGMKVVLAQDGARFTLPVLYRGTLAGLMMSYSQSDQRLIFVPAPVIDHFLRDLADGTYDGFPRAGFSFSSLENPQLREYVGLPPGQNGILIDKVQPGGAAAKGGLQSGDVLLAIDQFAIDDVGQYRDPEYGKLSIAHLTTTRSFPGEIRVFKLYRHNQELLVNVALQTMKAEDNVVPPYVIDRPPDYVIVGGLVIQTLSRQYLKQWGPSWQGAAPHRLRYCDRHQWDLRAPGQQFVLLSHILHSGVNMGYEALRYLIITQVNGQPIYSLGDLTTALKTPVRGFHQIEFEEHPMVIYLNAEEAARDDRLIQQRYKLPALQRMGK